MSGHTPGPWRWEINEQYKHVCLVGGRPQYDLTILEPIRWGMGGATFHIRDTAFDGMNLMHKLHERRDWITPFPSRDHHKHWCASVVHPDMRLIAAAPMLLEALKAMRTVMDMGSKPSKLDEALSWRACDEKARSMCDAAIAAATGETK